MTFQFLGARKKLSPELAKQLTLQARSLSGNLVWDKPISHYETCRQNLLILRNPSQKKNWLFEPASTSSSAAMRASCARYSAPVNKKNRGFRVCFEGPFKSTLA